MQRHICVVPARAGSKSIKNKNLIKLNQKTLVRIAVEQAIESKIFDKVIVTSDYLRAHLEIDRVKQNHTQVVYMKRRADLCKDDSLMIDVIKDALSVNNGPVNWVWVLQPTSPFRRPEDFKAIKKAIDTEKYKSVVSFKPVEDHPNRCYTWKDGKAHPLRYVSYDNKQDLRNILTRSGNFYVSSYEKLIEKNKLEIQPFYSHIMGLIDPQHATTKDIEWSLKCGLNIDGPRHVDILKGIMRRGEFRI